MKASSKLKIIFDSTITKIVIVVLLLVALMMAIILPSILNARPKDSILAFNRNSVSGTREAFVTKVLGDSKFVPSKKNVREVSTNDAMINSVMANKNSVGYASLSTVADFDEGGNAVIKDKYKKDNHFLVNFASFGDEKGVVFPPTEENIKSGDYAPSRDFNSFFRVENGSLDSKILNYNWENVDDYSNQYIPFDQMNDELKISFLFWSWMNESQQAFNFLTDNNQIPTGDCSSKIKFTNEMIKNYVNISELPKDNNIIEIVGSSSAAIDLSLLKNEFIRRATTSWGFTNLKIQINTIGSSIAFKKTIPGMKSPYIGIQSREPSEPELRNWNYSDKEDAPYKSFAKDAILIIYNTKGMSKDSLHLMTTSELMKKLYSNDSYYKYNDIFLPGVSNA